MRSFRDCSINTKLRLLVVLASSAALSLSCAAFVINDVRMIRASMVQQVSALADLLGSNSAVALTFDDANNARGILGSLQKQTDVETARLYRADGRPFADYSRLPGEVSAPAEAAESGYSFTHSGHLEIWDPIVHNGEIVGTIFLRASLQGLRDQYIRYLGIVVAVLVVSLAAAIASAARLQKLISTPILKLAATAQQISASRDYSIRVDKIAQDELGALYDQFNAMLDQMQQAERSLQQAHNELESRVRDRTRQLHETNFELNLEITERIRAEGELEDAHHQLMDAARRAGMAEIATGVLHNVGNVLNSINVSATLAVDRLRQSKVNQLKRAVDLLHDHADDLAQFIASDAQGKQVPAFLQLTTLHLIHEQADIVNELESLTAKVNHVKTIIATQQTYAGVAGVIENCEISDTIDDALKLNSASFDRHKVTVVRDYGPLPKIALDKQKLLQILVNLVKNAKDALADNVVGQRTLTFRTQQVGEHRLQIQIIDNGSGVAPENLTRIFTHGFTTKKKGHGFGLHSCANAAKEMGGSLTAHSEGSGFGAAFSLELPFVAVPVFA